MDLIDIKDDHVVFIYKFVKIGIQDFLSMENQMSLNDNPPNYFKLVKKASKFILLEIQYGCRRPLGFGVQVVS